NEAIIHHPSDAIILAYGQGAWGLHYTEERDFYLEQIIQNFESWQMQGAYPLDNFADWMVRSEGMNWQVYTELKNGSKYPEPWDFNTQNSLDIFANSAVTGSPPHSLHGGEMFNRHEYKLFTTGTDWTTAKTACEALGGHLVTIGSFEENNFVNNLAGSNRIWLGFTDIGTEGVWQWVTGESVTYTNWNPGEPNDSGGEDYAEMYYGGTWNDIDPGYIRVYVCEWEDWEVPSTTFYVNNTHRNATGTWNLGVGEELASNGNSDPDVYLIFDTRETVVQPNEWNVSVSNNLVNWHQVDSSDISAMTTGKGLAFDVDPLFARKKIMSAQYIRLTLITTSETKARRVDAIVIPYVARPLTIAASVTVDSLSFAYNETDPLKKIIFGGSDGRFLAFHSEEMEEIPYYKKYRDRQAELTGIPATNYGMVLPTFTQDWDSYTDAHFNLGETIWSIQGTSKKPLIPSWRFIEGITKEFSITKTGSTSGFASSKHI
ncbi:MAG: C-type lectin domain-containing protein, partial [Promethearchaeota archaeon]